MPRPPTRARATPRFGDVTIGSASGIDDIGQAGIGVLDPPLVAQNGRYVRTLTLFNQIAFDHIVRNRFFLRDALPAGAEPAAGTPGHRLPDRFDRREDRVDRRHRSAAGAGETVLHAHRAREARDRRADARA